MRTYCGMAISRLVRPVAYMARYQSPRCLIYWALALITINAFIIHIPALPEAYLGHTDLRQLIGEWQPTQHAIDGEIITNLSGWLAQSEQRHAKASSALVTTVFYQPRVIGLMLIGMALSKTGFFHRRFNNRQTLLPSFGLLMLATALSMLGPYADAGCQFSKRGNVSTDHLLVQSGARWQLYWWIVSAVPKPAIYAPTKGPGKPWESVSDQLSVSVADLLWHFLWLGFGAIWQFYARRTIAVSGRHLGVPVGIF